MEIIIIIINYILLKIAIIVTIIIKSIAIVTKKPQIFIFQVISQ